MVGRFLPSSQISGRRMYNTVVSINCMMRKVCCSPTLYRYWEAIIVFKWHKQDLRSIYIPLTGWGLHKFVWKFPREQHKARLIENITENSSLFSLVNTFKKQKKLIFRFYKNESQNTKRFESKLTEICHSRDKTALPISDCLPLKKKNTQKINI
jgi:hypothetical protein